MKQKNFKAGLFVIIFQYNPFFDFLLYAKDFVAISRYIKRWRQ